MSLDAGDFDFATSRAYYAMFYMAETMLLSLGLSFAKHSGVIAEFNRRFIRSGILAERHGLALRTAFEWRLVGDYDYGIEFPRETAVEAIEAADAFVTDVEAYLSAPPPPATEA
jgi:uncharacterized protein (UPF0332 family)